MARRCAFSLLWLSLVFAACAAKPGSEARSPDSPSVAQGDAAPAGEHAASEAPVTGDAPKPYTVEQLREAFPAGTLLMFRQEVDGAPMQVVEMIFEEPTADAVTVREVTLDENGKTVSEKSSTPTWEELLAHATFPAAATEVTQTQVETPAGKFDAALYTVKSPEGTMRFWFATKHPGPPVMMEREVDGKVVLRSTLLARKTKKAKGKGSSKK